MEVEKADSSRDHSSCSASQCPSNKEEDEPEIVSFGDGDPSNPYNFSKPKKLFIVVACMLLVMNSTIGSSIASGAATQTQQYFDITNDQLLVLPISIYLIGYVIGPLVFAVRGTNVFPSDLLLTAPSHCPNHTAGSQCSSPHSSFSLPSH